MKRNRTRMNSTVVVEGTVNGSEGNGIVSSKVARLREKASNPFLLDEYMEQVLPYIQDRKTLTTVRFVCKIWKHESDHSVKENVYWKIGPHSNSEQAFLREMAETPMAERQRTLKNFIFNHTRLNTNTRSMADVEKFLQEFGHYTKNLKLKSWSEGYLIQHFQPSLLPNLEHLELYSMSESVLKHGTLFQNLTPLTKVKSLCLNPEIVKNTNTNGRVTSSLFLEGASRVSFNILKACPNLKELEINLRESARGILRINSGINLTALTSFKNSLCEDKFKLTFPSTVVLKPLDLKNLVIKCPNLKVLSINVSDGGSKEKLFEMLSKYSCQLEELYLSICTMLDPAGLMYYTSSGLDDTDSLDDFDHFENDDYLQNVHHEDNYFHNFFDFYDPISSSEDDESSVGSSFDEWMIQEEGRARWIDDNPNNELGQRNNRFPDFPLLKKLVMVSWFASDFEKLGNMPLLQKMDIRLMEGVVLNLINPSTVSYPAVTCLKYRGAFIGYATPRLEYLRPLSGPMVRPLKEIFPNITELDVELGGNDALRAVYLTLQQLKKLHLNRSKISDHGITGIWWTDELKEAYKYQRISLDAIVAEHRKCGFIGNLKNLQVLTYTGCQLTNHSIEFGIIWLKELRSLKFPPFVPPDYEPKRIRHYKLLHAHLPSEQKVLVNVRLLVDNLKYLIKLDVNDDTDLNDDKWLKAMNNDVCDYTSRHFEYKGCGIVKSDLQYIKENAPSVEVVYSERRAS